jgi:NAD(P)-dependent dehydrogenase (short-subunit alcohol dehydrogenase family)
MGKDDKDNSKGQAHHPAQTQDVNPGSEAEMTPKPKAEAEGYKGTDKLKGKVALVTGGDSGIGRSVSIHFAKEGADVAIVFHVHVEDAEETKRHIEKAGRKCILIQGDLRDENFCRECVTRTVKELGALNILVNNAAYQMSQEKLEDIPSEQIRKTFETNIYSIMFVTQEALKHMKEGDNIINTTSVTSYKGNPNLIDYSSTKGAITSFTRALAQNLVDRKIRVNGVAPGPVWTPFIPSSFPADKVKEFGKDTHLGRPCEPDEIAPGYVFLADTYSGLAYTGQILHPNGGRIVNG